MADRSPIRVVFNNKALLFGKKTGIGYYIHNLYAGLIETEGVLVYPTVADPSTDVLGFMSRTSQLFRRVAGNKILKLSVPVGDFLVSRRRGMNRMPEADIYHETSYDVILPGKWKTVATVHDLAFVKHPEYFPKGVRERFLSNLKHIMKADRFIVTTDAVKNELVEFSGASPLKVDVIPLAPSWNCHVVDKGANEGRKQTEQYVRGAYIICVGTIEPRKNIPALLRAFSTVRSKRPLKLVLTGGKGWLYDEVVELPRKLGIVDDVVFTGYVDEKDLLYLYNYAAAAVYPSFYEGFGLPVVEAMACGTPVITSNIPSLKEVSREAALVFNPEDHKELARKMDMILSSDVLRSELSRKGLQRANEFSWDKVVSSTVQTYKRVLDS